jgi:hypothetical protein
MAPGLTGAVAAVDFRIVTARQLFFDTSKANSSSLTSSLSGGESWIRST